MKQQIENKEIIEGAKFHIDTYSIKQYETERVVDDVTVNSTPSIKAKFVLSLT